MNKYDERDADVLKIPYAYQQKDVLRFLQKKYEGKARAMALLIYNTISWIASDFSNELSTNEVHNWPKVIATYSGVGISTVRKYIRDFIGWEIVKEERFRRKNGTWDSRKIIIPGKLPVEVHKSVDKPATSTEAKDSED